MTTLDSDIGHLDLLYIQKKNIVLRAVTPSNAKLVSCKQQRRMYRFQAKNEKAGWILDCADVSDM